MNSILNNKPKIYNQLEKLRNLAQPFFLPIDQCNGYQFIWLLVSLLFFVGLIGGCAGSTTCSVKIFRYQIVFASIASQLKRIHSPNGIFIPRYQGRQISDDILNSVLTFFVVFFASLGILAVLLSLTGLDLITSLSGAAAALANIGPGLGETIGPDGNFSSLSETAKWLLIAGMLIGRLELMAVYILFTLKFWRN